MRLWVLFMVSQYMPLYWPYMFHLVTVVRGLSAAEFGALKGIYYLSAIATEVPSGVAADRLGRRGAMVLGAFLNGGACLLYVRAESFEAFAVAEILFGVGTALVSGADSALLYDTLLADGRGRDYLRLSGRARTAGLLGTALALPFCDAFLVRDGDPTLTYGVTAGIVWLGALAAAFLVEPPRTRSASASAVTRAALTEVWTNRAVLALLVYTTGCFLLLRASNSLFFNPLLAAKGIPADSYGGVFAAMCVAGALVAWRVDWLESRLGARGTLALVPLLLIAMYGGLLATAVPAAAGLFLLSGAVSGVLSPVGQHLLNRMASSSAHRATAVAAIGGLARQLRRDVRPARMGPGCLLASDGGGRPAGSVAPAPGARRAAAAARAWPARRGGPALSRLSDRAGVVGCGGRSALSPPGLEGLR
ncbi:MAG: MFS transporter [Proteobacteria bacterium]|nr:MFS transporter [Pseudomonadota bacterium]